MTDQSPQATIWKGRLAETMDDLELELAIGEADDSLAEARVSGHVLRGSVALCAADGMRGLRQRRRAPFSTGDARPDANPKSAFGMTKPSISLVPPVAIIQEAAVFGLGARKYGPYNWRETSVSARIYVDAALRHVQAWQDGQNNDPESGHSHLAHARACLGIILDAEATGKLIDDRPLPGAAAEVIAKLTAPLAVAA